MDKNNVLSLTLNMDNLDKDFYNWSLLSYDIRKVSDDKCLQLYGCKNRELYNKIKSCILFNKPLEEEITLPQTRANTIRLTTESYDYSNIDRRDLIMRIGLAKSMNNDILISIIYPYDPELISDSNYKDKYKEEFYTLYNKFIRLNDKYQKLSNSYSIQLFGYNVRCMYQLILPDLSDDISDINQDYLNSYSSYIEECNTEYLVDKNIIELYKCKILHSQDSINEASTEGIFARTLMNEVNSTLTKECSENDVLDVIPYFTISEYNSIVDNNIEYDRTIEDIDNSKDWYNTVTKLYDKFIVDKDNITENTLLRLGWNPYIDPKKYMYKAKERQVKWFNEHCAHVIDLSGYNINNNYNSLFESTTAMNKMYDKLDLHPVYIILSYTNTFFGNIIRKVKSSTFTHSGFTLDSDLKEIYTFKFDTKNRYNGFSVESIDKYLEKFEDAHISILCLFVDSNTLSKLQDSLDYFTSNKSKTKYNFKNLINILRNKSKDNDPYNFSLVCSQFVDTILKLADIDITHKSSNLVIPQDFENINHPRVYKLYNGLARKYNEMQLEAKIELLLKNTPVEDISFNNFVEDINESTINLLTHRYNIIDNDNCNSILLEFYNYITPVSIR